MVTYKAHQVLLLGEATALLLPFRIESKFARGEGCDPRQLSIVVGDTVGLGEQSRAQDLSRLREKPLIAV